MYEDCWLWAGMVNKEDYGIIQVKLEGKWRERRAHRLIYEALVGDIPDKFVLDHLCRIPRCVNPKHLEPVTDQENILRGIGKAAKYAQRAHCSKGHLMTEGNFYIRRDNKKPCRRCKQCAADARDKYRASK